MTPKNTGQERNRGLSVDIKFWISMYRGILALVLGMLLLWYPNNTRGLLFNVMGGFWLLSGISLIQQGSNLNFEKKVAWVAGLLAMLTGVLVISRGLTTQWVEAFLLRILLGVVILLTGLLHIGFGGFGARFGVQLIRFESGVRGILGILEVLLGGLLVWAAFGQESERFIFIYWIATIWALIFGVFITGSALYEKIKGKPSSN